MEHKKGEVVFFYTTHTGRGALAHGFRDELAKADVVDIEAARGMPPELAGIFSRISAGDRELHKKAVEFIHKEYKKTGDPEMLFHIDVMDALLGSGKRVVFEKPRVKDLETPKNISPETLTKMLKDVAVKVTARSIEDGRRIADELGKSPGQRMLVVRGHGHHMTTGFLKALLERKGLAIPVREVFPPVRRSLMGTPLHVPLETLAKYKASRGGAISAEELRKIEISAILKSYLSSRGWKIHDIMPHTEHLVRTLSVSDAELKRLWDKPVHEVRSYFLNRGIDVEKPWWRHEEDALKKMTERMRKQRLERLR